tara:strand:+ start:2270 stop:2437 length:168 start_codon:yes stop_codon:yes gene_type:complete
MTEEENMITICSYEEFSDLCLKAGGDEMTYREIIKALIQINSIKEEILWEIKMNQ